jgi:hypothetical protein
MSLRDALMDKPTRVALVLRGGGRVITHHRTHREAALYLSSWGRFLVTSRDSSSAPAVATDGFGLVTNANEFDDEKRVNHLNYVVDVSSVIGAYIL